MTLIDQLAEALRRLDDEAHPHPDCDAQEREDFQAARDAAREALARYDAEREKLLKFLREDWANSLVSGDSGFEAVWETLTQGFVGYDNFTIEQLRKEAEDAGYEQEERHPNHRYPER